MNEPQRTTLLPASIIIAIVLMIGFGLSLIELPPWQPGWWQRGLLSAGVFVVGLATVGLGCTWIGNRLRFSARVNGAIVMAIGFVLLRLTFHASGLSDEPILRSLGSATFLGAIVGAVVGPRFETMPGLKKRRQQHSSDQLPIEDED